MTNYKVEFNTDTDGVIDAGMVYLKAESLAEAESKALEGLKPYFPAVERQKPSQPAKEGEEAKMETVKVEVTIKVTAINATPANVYLI